MLKKIILLLAIVALIAIPIYSAADIIEGEQVQNGIFDTDTNPWVFIAEFGGVSSVAVENGECKVTIKNTGTEYWSIRITHEKIQFVKGQTYIVKFDARSTQPRDICVMCEYSGDPYTKYFGVQNVAITDKMAPYSFEFTMKSPKDNRGRLVFGFGKVTASLTQEHNVYLDNISVMMKK